MEDLKKKAKLSVLEDLISMMKDKEAEDFKGKSSKFLPKAEMTIEVEANPEEDDEKMETINRMKEFQNIGERGNNRYLRDTKQEMQHEQDEMLSKPQDDDEEDIERLKEMYSRLK